MKTVFLVLSPFNYTYNQTKKFYQAGERLTFDYKKNIKELEYILDSSNKNLIILDKYNSHPKVINEVETLVNKAKGLEIQSFDRLNNQVIDIPAPSRIQEITEAEKVIIRPPVQVKDVVETEEAEVKEETEMETEEAKVEEAKVETEEVETEEVEIAEETEAEEEVEEEVEEDSEFKYSQKYLDTLGWRKLKKLMTAENLEYTNQEEAIKALATIKK